VKTLHKRIGLGVAAIVTGSAFAVAPFAAGAQPARVCLDNGSASQCTSVVNPHERVGGGSGNEVTLVLPAAPGRLDAKDHPNYGPVVDARVDAKDHPNYGPVVVGRLDAKDHPNYGPSGASATGRTDAKDHPNY
jgi:hypothetical protein